MKKVMCVILAAFMVVSFFGCKKSDSQTGKIKEGVKVTDPGKYPIVEEEVTLKYFIHLIQTLLM